MDIVLILQDIRSLHNVGSIFRTADAFGVSKIWLCGYTGTPPRKEISKVALGAETWVPWERRKGTALLVSRLKADGYQVIALETGPWSEPISQVRVRRNVALILGNEIDGISHGLLHRADAIAAIPMLGMKGSLNVSVAAGVALALLRAAEAGKKKRKVLGPSVRRRGARSARRPR